MKRILCLILLLWAIFVMAAGVASAQSKEEALRLNNEADKLRESPKSRDDLVKAVQKYEQAMKIFERLGDHKRVGMCVTNLGIVYAGWGQYPKAVEYFEKDLAICRKLGDLKGEGMTLTCLGIVFRNLGQYPKAVEYYEKSLGLSRKVGNVKTEGMTLGNLGVVYACWGQYPKAVEYFEKDLAITRKIGDLKGEGATLNNLGIMFRDWGQYQKAVEYYEKSLAITRKIGDVQTEGQTLGNLGNVFKDWGQYPKAVEYYEKSLGLLRKVGDLKDEGQFLNNLGVVLQDMGEPQKALELFRKGLAIWTEIKVPTRWPKALVADLHMDAGDLAKAEPLLREANYNTSWGRFYLLKGDYPKAKEYYEKIRKSAEENRDADNLFTAYTGLGAAAEGLKDNAGAAEYYEKAVTHTEDLRSSLAAAEREKFFDVRINGFFRTAPYEGLARVLMNMHKPVDALKQSEYTKARLFAEAISKRSGYSGMDVPKEVRDKDAALTDRLAALHKNLQKAYEKGNKQTIASLEPQVKEAKVQHGAHVEMLRKQYPLFAATKYPRPMDMAQTAVKENEWVLSYDVTDPGFIVYLTKGKALKKALFKPVTRKDLDALVRKFREPFDNVNDDNLEETMRAFDFAAAKRLSDILLADVLPELPKGTPLIIVPADCLGVLPFEMLVLNTGGKIVTKGVIPNTSGAEFFGDRNPISYYQSITALTLARNFGRQKGSGTRMLVMCDPVFSDDDPRFVQARKSKRIASLNSLTNDVLMSAKSLQHVSWPRMELTKQLGESLKTADPGTTDVYEGLQATKATFRRQKLTDYRSIVFATHGYAGMDLGGLREPVLVLTLVDQPEGENGFLGMSEVMGLKMNADVVALTACQSGLGKRVSGEGTMGMGRAFQYAGAKSSLMTLWSVAQRSSVDLTGSFFKHLKEGKPRLEALRLARDEIRKAGYDHPFFWAPFILVGEVN